MNYIVKNFSLLNISLAIVVKVLFTSIYQLIPSKTIVISNFILTEQTLLPTVSDGGDEIVLANWPNYKHIICKTNNDIPVKIPSHPYVLVNRGILCNCGIEVDNHYLLELIAACDNRKSKLVMYFTINMAFTNYLEMFPNITESFSLIRDRTTHEQP